MPCDYSLYPKNWKTIRAEILARAGSRCECVGECRGMKHAAARCFEVNGKKALEFRGKVVLTIAHLNNKSLKDVRRSNLKAMCQACHLRLDAPFKAIRRRRKAGGMRKWG